MADGNGDVDLKIRVARARQAKREIDDVGKSVRGLGDDVKKTGKQSKDASRGMDMFTGSVSKARVVALGLGGLIGVGGLVTAGLPLMAGGLAAGAAGLVAFAGAGLFAKLVADRFAQTSTKAGTAAFALVGAWAAFQKELRGIAAPAADQVMKGLAAALEILQPALKALEVPLAVFGQYLAEAIQLIAFGMVPLFPKLATLIEALAPLLTRLPDMIVPLLSAFLDLAIVGTTIMPGIATGLVWVSNALADTMAWLGQFVIEMQNGTGTGGQFASTLGDVRDVGADVVSTISDIVGWFQKHDAITQTLIETLALLVVGIGLYKAAMVVAEAATIAWSLATTAVGFAALFASAPLATLNALFLANPVGVVIIALIALGALFVLLYTKVGWFRDGVNAAWEVLKNVPFVYVITHLGEIVDFIKGIPGSIADFVTHMWDGLKSSFAGALNWMIDKLNWFIHKVNMGGVLGVLSALPGVPNLTIAEIAHIPEAAQGGVVRRGGAVDVGEHGKERLWLPPGAAIQPLPPGGVGDYVIVHTHVMLNDTEIATAVHKAATRKASTR